MTISVRHLSSEDIPLVVEAFLNSGWTKKPASTFEQYVEEQQAGERVVWLAFVDDEFAGYITLKWLSDYEPFRNQTIPEIVDLNVLPTYRNKGVATTLLEHAEELASKKSNTVGIGVGLYAGKDGGYAAAQRLYIKQGYYPDAKGVAYKYKPVIPGKSYPIDDDLILWFTKSLG